ncbi:MAG TPA: tRNA pseudouridine(38-40) synthase TruA, partial [Planctomycetaceae bacterium]|nr:tRNA pseudouridine(38-40) synthase TruA [Planctomycetaceae bacterium]
TNYVGWQVQPNGPSVQAAVEHAIQKLTGEAVRVAAAGRTDSGVHALGQVVSFRTGSAIPCDALRNGLQHFLPDDVVVRNAEEAPDDFHATYSARRKRYRYVIHNSRVPDPFVQRYAWRVSAPLDAAAMDEAARVLVGTHDFRCFESQFPNKATSIRTVFEASAGRCSGWPVWDWPQSLIAFPAGAGGGEFVWFDVAADGFLYNMVRAIVGTLMKVGLGQWTAEDVRTILARQDRAQAGETAPPQGLFLVHVEY